MYTDARKIHLIEEVLKVTNEDTLARLEDVLKNPEKKESVKKKKKPGIYDFVGILSKKESAEMKKAIEETCEIINPDDWK